ncbi:uncharacterized protein PHALS_08514 [Plasmopara halstedii]|uniref:Uncharacterized protein n=1 Tax=Plasmopara halstedii TaxID=4781 RepID=A0A0P1ACP7_PLAHL|nr:uncharacterized protein PHALS_08514 [Plasmopara halstedii]CEG38437.1 hypothetical protein PHALS_08514 [Plasmopara halstedii]|eukprot:XP_024574806.1 hypothetical protein PHALS_08514 [Plasmopara halstedii]
MERWLVRTTTPSERTALLPQLAAQQPPAITTQFLLAKHNKDMDNDNTHDALETSG